MRWWQVAGALVVLGLLLDRAMVAAEARGWVYWRRRPTSGSATAAAFGPIEALLRPSSQYTQEQRQHEELRRDAQDEGEPPEPATPPGQP